MKKMFLTASVLAFLAGVMTAGFAPAPAYAEGKKPVVCADIKDAKKQAACKKKEAAKMKKEAAKMKKKEK